MKLYKVHERKTPSGIQKLIVLPEEASGYYTREVLDDGKTIILRRKVEA